MKAVYMHNYCTCYDPELKFFSGSNGNGDNTDCSLFLTLDLKHK